MSDIQLPNGWTTHQTSDGKQFYFNTVSRKSQWHKPSKPANQSLLPEGWVELQHRKTGKLYYRNKITGEIFWVHPNEGPNCNNIRGLKWKGNSCYVDSTLLSFFAVPTEFTDNILNMDLKDHPIPEFARGGFPCGNTRDIDLVNRQKVQDQLRNIANSIRGIGTKVDYCTDLRKAFKNCPDIENYHDANVKDAGEFLGYILSMFPVNTAVSRKITYGTNDMQEDPPKQSLVETSNVLDDKASIIITVDPFTLLKYAKGLGISNIINHVEDSGPEPLSSENLFRPEGKGPFKRRITVTTLEKAPYVVFSLKRIDSITGNFINTIFFSQDKFVLPSGQRFRLSAIVIYSPGHYTCTFRCGKEWYYYNDMGGGRTYELRKLGDIIEMLRIRPVPTTVGTQYFYTPF